ncbi:MAG: protein phosphatase 2C domain-containing protein [Oscillospiraceae bacterium]|jgi:protein phosphatase|nr:protein phosphatase 2C domain-containing protein [Oscillospiraceae bacterium]
MRKSAFDIAARSVLGTRESQQDYARFSQSGSGLFAVVCDGMGGLGNGEIASKTAALKLRDLYKAKQKEQPFPEFFQNCAELLDNEIYNLTDGFGDRLRAGTTLVAAAAERGKLYWLSVGDSRLYIIRGGEMICVTRDHNYFLKLNQLRDSGQIDEAQYNAEAPRGESLTSYLGMGGLELIDINETAFELQSGDRLLLTTDGLYRSVDLAQMRDMITRYNPAEAALKLTNLAEDNSAGGLDNTTCVIIRYSGD